MGKEGNTLMLQFGGVQAAIIAAPPPAEEDVAEDVVLPRLQFALPVLTEPGLEEHQVRKLPLITLLSVSVTVAVMLALLPRVTDTVFPPPKFVGARVMD